MNKQKSLTPDTGLTVRVAAAQFFSGDDVKSNLKLMESYIRQASEQGVDLLVTPENSNRVRNYASREECFELSESLDGLFVTGVQAAAKKYGVMVAVGVDLRGASSPDVYITQVLIDSTGEILHVHHKTVFWDYEYTLFTPGSKELEVIDTRIGRIGMLLCADGIVPEVPRVLSLKGAEILTNSLNSRGPDEMRVHEPLRSIENHVWHIAANTVGGPKDAYPWTGGSQIISPTGEILACAGETEERMVVADITPSTSFPKNHTGVGNLDDFRRPDLYGELLSDNESHRAASMFDNASESSPTRPLRVATLQTSWYHSTEWTMARAAGQVEYAAKKGVQLGVFPELFIHRRDSIESNIQEAATLSAEALATLIEACAQHSTWVVVNLIEKEESNFYSTAYLIGPQGVQAKYRKCHLSEAERQWATPGDDFVVADTEIGRIGLMIGNEVWLPEVARILTLRGAEVIAHPADWDRLEAATQAATERTEENRTHLVSCARLDNAAEFGSQIVIADRFIPGQPVALMRYPTAIWSRTGFEEDIFYDLDLTDSHIKMQGYHLNPVATRQPHLYSAFLDQFRKVPTE